MGSFSDYLELEVLDHICNVSYTPEATVYLALGTACDDTGLTEFSGNGYTRESIAFDAAASRSINQTSDVEFGPVSTAEWTDISHWAIYDASTVGNMLAWGAFTVTKSAPIGRSPKVVAGEVDVTVSAGGLSDTWAEKILNRVFRNITSGTTIPTTYVALVETLVADSDTDITAKEPSGNYARELVDVNGGASPTWDIAAAGALDNTHQIDFNVPNATWDIVGMAICDAVTTGNVIFHADITDETANNGDPVNFPIGDLDITLS